ncbi:MAG: phosphoribosylaminoimidazolesuccinocarboxamide synthase [Dehalococcoidia bacterium]
MTDVLLETDLPVPRFQAKVRDIYDLGDRLLIVATDRVSAFDVVMSRGIPDKGAVLTQLSAFWFEKIDAVVPTHFIRLADGTAADELPFPLPPELVGRSMIVRKARRLDFECIARGYLAGSGWAEYQRSGTVCGIRLPDGLEESQQLPDPIFTPSTKAESGHDENISYDELVRQVGADTANVLRLRSLAVYRFGWHYAAERGILIADTKFEFGERDGELILIDEALTPDSSRFWPLDRYRPGGPQPSFDKQPLRDWLEATGWNKEPPPPDLTDEVVEATAERYREAYRRLTGAEVRPAGGAG